MSPAPDRPRRLETRDEAAAAARAAQARTAAQAGETAGTEATARAGRPAQAGEPAQVENSQAARPAGGAAKAPRPNRLTSPPAAADKQPTEHPGHIGVIEEAAPEPATTTPAETDVAASDQAARPAFVGRAPAGYSVGGRLGELLEPVFAAEPPVGDAVAAIFERADRLRHRKSRAVVAAGVVVVLLVFLLGYGLTTVLLPASPRHTSAAPVVVEPPPDPVPGVLGPLLAPAGLRIVPTEPARGDGWRQYLVLNGEGRPRGLVEVSAYTAPEGLCFPVLADKGACARPDRASDDVEYARYTFDRDVDWQVHEVIARRLSNGRVIVVQATGERGTGKATSGRPPLSALLTAKTATDARVAAAFGPGESCNGSDPACPILRVPVPVVG